MVRLPPFVMLCLASLVSAALLAATPAPTYAVPLDSPSAYSSGYTRLCYGYLSCANAGYSNAGYAAARGTMYWRMYAGHNCTNYAAYRMVRSGMPNSRPWSGSGNATNWGSAMSRITSSTPTVGAVAWWRAYARPAGSAGHVAYVERVVSANEIIVSQDSWGGDFSWARITRSSGYWPSGFVHFNDVRLRNTALPSVTGTPMVARTLTARPGSWSMSGTTYTYQWRSEGNAIPGATSSTFKVPASYVGRTVRVRVFAHRSGQSTVYATSRRTAAVTPAAITLGEPAAVTGTPRPGQRLTVTFGMPKPRDAEVAVQWLRAGVPVTGATGSTYPVSLKDLGSPMSARLTLTRTGYARFAQQTPSTANVRTLPVLTPTLTPGARRLTVRVAVTSRGTSPVTGVVAVRREKKLVGLMRLSAGAARMTFTNLEPGVGHFRLRYRGSDRVSTGHLWRTTTIAASR